MLIATAAAIYFFICFLVFPLLYCGCCQSKLTLSVASWLRTFDLPFTKSLLKFFFNESVLLSAGWFEIWILYVYFCLFVWFFYTAALGVTRRIEINKNSVDVGHFNKHRFLETDLKESKPYDKKQTFLIFFSLILKNRILINSILVTYFSYVLLSLKFN